MVEVQHLKADASIDDVEEVVKEDGAVIIENVLDADFLSNANAECRPFIDNTPMGQDEFSGTNTTRTGALVWRSKACQDIIMNPTVLGFSEKWLDPFCERVQLNLSQIIRILPGETAQPIHRDRWAWGAFIPHEVEVEISTIWALSEFTAEKGATQVVPGSHKWEPDRMPEPHEITQAVMPAGSVLVYSGSTFHGGGANTSQEERLGFNVDYVVGWLRQEENQYLTCPPEYAKKLPQELTDLMGYSMGNYVLGYYSVPDMPGGEGAGVCPPEAAIGRTPSRKSVGLDGMDIPEDSGLEAFG